MILLDQPRWPAHGTLFGHLVSDHSLDELHAFAEALGLAWQAFDHDHYDVAERFVGPAVALGAHLVPESELIRRLISSGLRVRQTDRVPSRGRSLPTLQQAWTLTELPSRMGLALLDRWQEPHRRYHDVRHLADMLTALDHLGATGRTVQLAAWFHDAVHQGVAGEDEERSADLARHLLGPHLPAADVAEVSRLVLLTRDHAPEPGDDDGAAVCDADLAVLARPAAQYDVYVRDVRSEYAHLTADQWRQGRSAVLRSLLDRSWLFSSQPGRQRWESAARSNLTRELARWQAPGWQEPGRQEPGRQASGGQASGPASSQ